MFAQSENQDILPTHHSGHYPVQTGNCTATPTTRTQGLSSPQLK